MDRRIYRILIVLAILCGVALKVQADVIVVVNKSNEASLDEEKIKNIFLGKAKYFPDGKAAIPLQMHPGSADYSSFASKVLGKDDNQLRAYWTRLLFTGRATPPKEVDSESQVIDLVAHNPNLIGYVSASSPGLEQVRVVQP